jgi:hypothetical protein
VAATHPEGADEVKTGLRADGVPVEVGTDHRTSDLTSL